MALLEVNEVAKDFGGVRALNTVSLEVHQGEIPLSGAALWFGVCCFGPMPCSWRGLIALSEDRRIFTPLAPSSYALEREYKRRTDVERVNNGLDVSFVFEKYFIRQ